MPSEKQIAANRRNAQKSTGPRTEAGKHTSSLNAYRHGLTAHILLTAGEQSEAQETFISKLVDDLKPVGAMEEKLARSVAETHWRLDRAVAIEHNVFAYDAWNDEQTAQQRAAQNGAEPAYDDVDRALAAVRCFAENSRNFHLLTVYEMRLHRRAQADLRQLRELQSARLAEQKDETKPAQPAPSAKPAAVPQAPELSTLTPPNGFVCSDRSAPAAISDKTIADFLENERRIFDATHI